MDPNSGRLYPSAEAAHAAGVLEPVELFGKRKDITRVSQAVQELHKREVTARDEAQRKAKRKEAKKARKIQHKQRKK